MLILALVVRLVAVGWWEQRHGALFAFGDSESYWHLGRAIARGEPYEFGSADARVFRAPGYPLVLASMFVAVGDHAAVVWGRVLSAIAGTLAVGGVGWLGWVLFDRRVGWGAALAAAIYPGAIALSVFVLSEAPFCPLMLAQLAFWGLARRAECGVARTGYSLAAGLAGGAAVLMRPSWLLFTPLAAVVGCLDSSAPRRQVAIGALMLAGLTVVMLPWWIRNARVTGHFVATTLQVGASWYDGWSPQATGASNLQPAQQRAADLRAAGFPPGTQVEYEIDRRLRHEAWQWAKEHPARVLSLAATKFGRMWNVWPNEPAFRSWWIGTAVAISYLLVLGSALAGSWQLAGRGWPIVMLWLPAIYLTAIHMVFVGSIRYREPAMLPLMVLGMAWIVDRFAGQATKNHDEIKPTR